MSCSPSAVVAACISFACAATFGLFGFTSRPIDAILGARSRSSSSRFAPSSTERNVAPVTFPPGRFHRRLLKSSAARLAEQTCHSRSTNERRQSKGVPSGPSRMHRPVQRQDLRCPTLPPSGSPRPAADSPGGRTRWSAPLLSRCPASTRPASGRVIGCSRTARVFRFR